MGREDVEAREHVAALVAIGIGHGHFEEVVAAPTGGVGGVHVDQERTGVRCRVATGELDAVEAVANRRNGDFRDDLGHLLHVEDALALATVGVGHQDAEGARGHADGGVAQFGLRNHDFAAGAIPVAIPLVLDEGVHGVVADRDDGRIVAANRVRLDADVRQEVQALVDEEVLRSGTPFIDCCGDVECSAETVRAFRTRATEGPFVAVEVVVAGDGRLLSRADAEVAVHGQCRQLHVDHFDHIFQHGLAYRRSVVRGGDGEVVHAHVVGGACKEGIQEGHTAVDVGAVVGDGVEVGQFNGHRLAILRGEEADVEVQRVVEADEEGVATATARGFRRKRSLVRVGSGHVDAEILAVEPEASVLLIRAGTVRTVVAVVLEVEAAELDEVGEVVLRVHTDGGRVGAAAPAFTADVTVGPLHVLVAELDVAASTTHGDGAVRGEHDLVADRAVVVVVVVAHIHPVHVHSVRCDAVEDVAGEAVVGISPVAGDDVVVRVRQLFGRPVDDRFGEGDQTLGVDVEFVEFQPKVVEGEGQGERTVGIVHVDACAAGLLLELGGDFRVALIRLDPAVTAGGAHQALLLAALFALEVFGRFLMALDDRNHGFLVIALPAAVDLPFIPIHHHHGEFKAAVFGVNGLDFSGQRVLCSHGGGQANEGQGEEDGSHGGVGSRGGAIYRNGRARGKPGTPGLCTGGDSRTKPTTGAVGCTL